MSEAAGDLFSHHRETLLARLAPLADRLRPRSLEEFVGQEAILAPGRLLHRAIAADRVGNLILHGPPGTGKTTLARIIAASTRSHFCSLNAVLAGVKDLRAAVEAARERLARHGLRTLLFIDEVHRFNAAQQDALLPWVENGTVTLIGATTENPYFEVNKALVSRARLFRLQPLEPSHLHALLQRALSDPERGYGDRAITLEDEAAEHLVDVAGGDARSLLNALELAVESSPAGADGRIRIDLAIAEESIQQRAVLYDKQGDAHFDTISAFIKSLRGSDPDAALFWLARMVEAGENPRFIFRRLLIAACEDVGLADPQAVVVVEACAAAFERIGLPEGLYPLAQATLYLAGAEKSNSVLGFFDALRQVRASSRQQVPAHLRDANRDGQAFGDGVDYRYPHAYAEHWVAQQYLPAQLQGQLYWQPGQLGWEGALRQRLQQRRAAQLAAAAESELDRGECLSSGPDEPGLERWLQRQASAEGERLDALRRRFWQGVRWQRHDRVLVLDAQSLLWALDPLEATPEGGVVITTSQAERRERLSAQLQVLDALRRPEVLLADAHSPAALLSQLQEPFQEPFRVEWLAARQPFPDLEAEAIPAWVEALGHLVSPGGQWRLLFTAPLLGPAGGLLELRDRGAGEAPSSWLSALAAGEAGMLARRQALAGLWAEALEVQGWLVRQERWQEGLNPPLQAAQIERWLQPGSRYRQALAPELDPATGPKTAPETGPQGWLESLAGALRQQLGQPLPQRLQHVLLQARRP